MGRRDLSALLGSCRGAAATIFVITTICRFCFANKAPQTGTGEVIPHAPACRNVEPGVAYVGSEACKGCHADIYDQFIKTGMGRSMSLPTEVAQLEEFSAPVTVYNKDLDRHFRVFRKGRDIYQSEYELGPNGKKIFETNQKIEYALGSGENGTCYIVRRGSYLYQAPLTYYSKVKAWGLSPGYEERDYGFDRPIRTACITCHSGRPQPVPNGEGLFRNPAFLELSVGCENCHGPGQLHVEARLQGGNPRGPLDLTIVNPQRLPAWLANNVCMSCHQSGDAQVLRPGKDYLDFRPGTPLDDTVGLFAVPLSRSAPSSSPLLQHFSLIISSKCYRKSGGELTCITCHDPHTQPPKAESSVYYRGKCLKCHNEASCSLPRPERVSRTPSDNCAGCHMPKLKLPEIPHASLTNHRIVVSESEPFPDDAFHLVPPEAPDLIHLNETPGQERSPLPLLVQLQVYEDLMGSHPEYQTRYFGIVDKLALSDPNNVLVLEGLARKMRQQGTAEGEQHAIQYLSKAIEQGAVAPINYEWLAGMLAHSGQTSKAIDTIHRGIKVAPTNSLFYRSLGLLYVSMGNYPAALRAISKELELLPQDSSMRNLLKKVDRAAHAPDVTVTPDLPEVGSSVSP